MLKPTLFLVLTKYFIVSALDHLNGMINSNEINRKIYSTKVKCILDVVGKNIPCGIDIITVVNAESPLEDSILKSISNEYCNTLITRTVHKKNWLMSANVYVILISDSYQLPLTLFELSRDLMWNPGAKFIVVVHEAVNDNLLQIFNEFLKYRIYNVLLLATEDWDNLRAYTYYPLAYNNCGKRYNNVVMLGECNDTSNSNALIPREHSHDYHNCSITVGIHESTPYVVTDRNTDLNVSKEYKVGIEQLIIESIAVLEGIEIEYRYFSIDFDRGVVLPNNTSTGMMSYLQNNEISLAVGGFILILNRALGSDYIWGYNYSDLKLVIPAATEIAWKKVFREFGTQCWILISCSLCVVSLSTLLILKFSSKKDQDAINVILKLLDYLLDHSDDYLIRIRKLRLLLICWIWYTYFIISFYKTAYYSLITGHVKEKLSFYASDLNTLPYEICLNDVGRNFFLYAYNVTFPYKKSIENCQNTDGGLAFVVENREYYTIATEYVYNLKAPNYIDEDGNFELDSWNILGPTISSFYCSRGFPLKRRFQEHAVHIFESGLLQFQLNMMKVRKGHFTHNNKKYFKSLHLSDFRVSYCILLIGSIISLISFIFERYKTNSI